MQTNKQENNQQRQQVKKLLVQTACRGRGGCITMFRDAISAASTQRSQLWTQALNIMKYLRKVMSKIVRVCSLYHFPIPLMVDIHTIPVCLVGT